MTTFISAKEEIKRYIDNDETNGAVLISGDWGCGKSYFIKKIADDINQAQDRESVVAVISLFGINSLKELEKAISKVVLNELFNPNENKFKTIATTILEKSKQLLENLSGIDVINEKAQTYNTVLNINIFDYIDFTYALKCIGSDKTYKLVLVFDDFERCKIDIVDRMGFINEYVENRGIKVIVIADEKKIEDEKYREFKEKLIYQTLSLGNDNHEAAEIIIDSFKSNDEYCSYIKAHKQDIIATFIESRTKNLRLLKGFLIDFEKVYSSWPEDVPQDDDFFKVMIDFEIYLIENRAGRFGKGAITYAYFIKDGMNRDEKYLYSSAKYSYYSRRHELSTLIKWIVDSEWIDTDFWKDVRNKFSSKEITKEQRFLSTRFFDMEQDQFESDLDYTLNLAYDGKLDNDEYIQLLMRTTFMRDNQVSSSIPIDYHKMIEGVKKRKEYLTKNPESYQPISSLVERDRIGENEIPIYDKILEIELYFTDYYSKQVLLNFFKGKANGGQVELKNASLTSVDDSFIEEFWGYYCQSSNAIKNDFITIFDNLYLKPQFRDIRQTVDSFNKLIERLNHSVSNNNLIVDAIHRRFIEVIKNIIARYNISS